MFQEAISRRLSDVSITQHNQDESSGFENSNPNLGEGSFVTEKSSNVAPVIAVHEKKWTDGSVPLDSISSELAKLGKVLWISEHLSNERLNKQNIYLYLNCVVV